MRQAILDANASTGTTDTIAFNIAGAGVKTIAPTSALPDITDPVIIDGYTQPGSSQNTLAVGNDAVLLIEIDGSGQGTDLFHLMSDNNVIRGLVINRAPFDGIQLDSANGGNIIQGNFIGTDPTGTIARGNGRFGVSLFFFPTANNQIGGATPAARNLISANGQGGVVIGQPGSTNNVVRGNYIGTTASGTTALGGGRGVFIGNDATGNTVGGTTTADRNVISGNNDTGVLLLGNGATNNVVRGNYIGVAADGVGTLGNNGFGVGIGDTATGNAVLSNLISGSAALGIDLSGNGVTANDANDADTGPNNLQNFPVLTSAVRNGSNTNVQGTLNSTPNTNGFIIEFFANATCDPAGNGEGQRLLGTITVNTDASGNASVNTTITAATAGGESLTATATDPAGNTSEFSQCFTIQNTPQTFTVTNTNDAGAGSLRQAILDANANNVATDTIAFNIAGAGVKTIAPTSALPDITDPVIIDGYTQPGSSVNTLIAGDNAVLLIELDGTNAGANVDGLRLFANNSIVRGLAINRFSRSGIVLVGSTNQGDNITISGNFIGTDAAGMVDLGNGTEGISVEISVFGQSADNALIGGSTPAARNIISGNRVGMEFSFSANGVIRGNFIGLGADGTTALGNTNEGMRISSFTSGFMVGGDDAADGATDGVVNARNYISGNGGSGIFLGQNHFVLGNYIGTDVTGTLARPNNGGGIGTNISHNTVVGGASPGAGNLISGNNGVGVGIYFTNNFVVKGNRIGTQADGVSALGNTGNGVEMFVGSSSTQVGGTAAGEGNIIAFNGQDGVTMDNGTNNSILSNSIHSNGTINLHLGIDLGTSGLDGVTPNDAGDGDTGPNNLQNFPVLASATSSGGNTIIAGTFNSEASKAYRIEFFSNAACDASGNGEGRTFLGFQNVNTDGSGNASINATLPTATTAGEVVTATATDPSGNTSEFSQCAAVATNAQTFTVTSTNDAGAGSLRQAILDANASTGTTDTIAFNIAGAGVKTIAPTSVLPTITDPIIIDGYTQPGSSPNTLATGNDAVLLIELNGASAGAGTDGLRITSSGSIIRGLVINGFNDGLGQTRTGVNIFGAAADNNTVEGCFIGTNAAGTASVSNNRGIHIHGGAGNNTVGGTSPAARNVISNNSSGVFVGDSGAGEAGTTGNVVADNYIGTDKSGAASLGAGGTGVLIQQAANTVVGGTSAGAGNVISGNGSFGLSLVSVSGVQVQGNRIGTNAAGTAAVGNGTSGVSLSSASGNTIGGATTAHRNVISGNGGAGISIDGSGNIVRGNFIGTDASGTSPLPNDTNSAGFGGISIDQATSTGNQIGGTNPGEGNRIAFNTEYGVQIFAATGNRILGNSIFSNGTAADHLGIEFDFNGVIPNDAGDPDTGANNHQNFPVLTSATFFGTNTRVKGTLNSAASTTFRIEFFSNTACDTSGNGEGATFLGSAQVKTDASGNASFDVTLIGTPPPGEDVVATATDPAGNTSEFSNCQILALANSCGSTSFGAPTNFGTGSGPAAVIVGDFNNDGVQDLATANGNTNDVSVLLGNGAGSFGAATNFAVGNNPRSVAAGDFNGDGNLDLATANAISNDVSILLGNGAGGFAAATSFSVGTGPQSVAVSDFNGDGNLDLVVANRNSNDVSVLLGNGAGGFAAATSFSVGTGPQSVAVGDFNGDGNLDLVVANRNSNDVSVLLGNGAGGFAAATNFAVGNNPRSVAVGDFNGDGNLDLAVANTISNDVSILLGNGAGGFAAATNFGVGSNSVSVAVGDFNGDGNLDLAVANISSNDVSVLLGNGAGGFAAATNFGVATNPESVAVGDFNGDGKPDLATANSNPNNVSILLNSCTSGPQTFVVTNTNDAGAGSLRQAITNANASTGTTDTITFNIAGAGVKTIAPTSALPNITDPIVLDGYTQPGASVNTQAVGNNAVLLIELSGSNAPAGTRGLIITAGNSTVRGLVINRFSSDGILLQTAGNNSITGNFIGTDPTGTTALNNQAGIRFSNSSPNVIGGTAPAARNIILGNANPAIFDDGVPTGGGNIIQGNYIASNASGTALLGTTGINLSNSNNLIGGTATGAGNVIGTAAREAIKFQEVGASNNIVQGNLIGVTADGTGLLGGITAAITILRSNGNLIGGTDASDGTTDGVVKARNIIVGSSGGVGIGGSPGTGQNNIVQGNFIGTNAAGSAGLPAGGSAGVGVDLQTATNNTVGGTAAGAGNVISGFNIGVRINFADSNIVQSNFIGTNATGNAAIPNNTGVSIFGNSPASSSNTIGGTTAAARNIISGNTSNGIIINGGDSNTIQGNFIGVKADGTSALGNGFNGIEIDNGTGNQIGGTAAGAGNTIANNAFDGVALPTNAPTGNAIRGNSIFSNGTTAQRLGIDLGTDGVTPNDAGDADTGPNNLQNFPVLASATSTGGSTNVTGTLNSTASTLFRVEFFSNAACDTSGNGEGRTFLGFQNVTTDGFGNASINQNVAAAAVGEVVTATATDPFGNTSEFSQCAAVATNAQTFTVTSTNDAGAGSLRQAILDANASTGTTDTISFNIAGTGVQTINLTSALPDITDPVIIDGYTQPGASANTLAASNDAVLLIDIAGNTPSILTVSANNSVVRGLALHSSGNSGVVFSGSNNIVEGCFIGTNAAGTAANPNSSGVRIIGANNHVGGAAPSQRNLISGNNTGVFLDGAGATGNVIEGNFIGTSKTGASAVANFFGITVSDAPTNQTGGTAAGAGNVISGNIIGITVINAGSTGNVFEGNLVGTDPAGVSAVPNNLGVRLSQSSSNTTFGGVAAGAGNFVAFNNPGAGIEVQNSIGNALLGNRINNNALLGIDLGGDGVTPNDAGDSDTGPNNLQNFPVLASATSAGGNTTIQGTFNSTPSTNNYRIEFFSNAACDASGNGEGRTFLGSTSVNTDGSGNATINTTLLTATTPGEVITATATDPAGNTSEFSACQTVTAVSSATLGNYANTTVQLGANATITPSAAPTNTTRITVSTSTNFKGTLEGDPTTGVVRITNAHPAGTYTVTVTAFDGSGISTSKTFTLSVATPATCNPVSFTAATNFGVGTAPGSVAVGDFNRDGKQDMAVVNITSNNVSVLLGDGAGSFGAATNFNAGTQPSGLAVGDFNGDGLQDLVTANFGTSNLSVLLGDGAGSFGAATNLATGTGPLAVVVGDFNGDGRQDLATANQTSNNVSVLLGDGAGGFGAATNFAVGTGPRFLALGDFNSDGRQDLATANQTSNNVSVLLGDGAGGFGAATNFNAGTQVRSVVVADFNGDGRQDLATANFISNDISLLLGDGAGGFGAATNFAAGTGPRSLTVGDFDGDGKLDLSVVNPSASTVSILLNNGAGGFLAPNNFATGTSPVAVTVGDFNADGKQDLVTVNQGSNNVSILLRTCPLSIFTVTNTNNSGAGSLRQAILDANALAGTDNITFNIPGTGVQTINLTSALPPITDPVVIDGYTQPGASVNTLAVGTNAVLLIELNGASAGATANGINVTGGGSIVRGLVINRFGPGGASGGAGVQFLNSSNNVVEGCFIGTDATGTIALPNNFDGITFFNSNNNRAGGTSPAQRNLVSGNNRFGFFVNNGSTGNSVIGNLIGTNATGTAALGNNSSGIGIFTSSGNTFGGAAAGEANVIAFNNGAGAAVVSGTGNAFSSNQIFSNAALGIDLGNNGVTPNDAGDGDTGANNLQNFPVLASAVSNGSSITIQGTLNSTASTTFRVEFFSNAACDSSGNGEGQVFLGSTNVTTDANNNASINVTLPIAVANGQSVTATATNTTTNDTSEFSACQTVTAGGAQTFTVTNTNDAGAGSLRQAITNANASTGTTDTIAFNISGSGVQTINLTSALPPITGPIIIDGYTQPGASANTLAVGDNAVLLIEINGAGTPFGTSGLVITAGNTTVSGLVINRFPDSGIVLSSVGGNTITGNFIGTNPAGNAISANQNNGVFIRSGSANNIVGGTTPAARNVVSGNGNRGVVMTGSGTSNNLVQGNYIGTNAAGTAAIPNGTGLDISSGAQNNQIGGTSVGARNVISGNGINVILFNTGANNNSIQGNFIGPDATGNATISNSSLGISVSSGAQNNTIGGTAAGAGNVISGNNTGVFITDANTSNIVVQGNLIGTTAAGNAALSNSLGVLIFGTSSNNSIGGTAAGAGNVIAFNSSIGVDIGSGTGNAVRGNSIHDNLGLGIDLGDDGLTANDAGRHRHGREQPTELPRPRFGNI